MAPHRVDILYWLGHMLHDAGRAKGAMATYWRAIACALRPDSASGDAMEQHLQHQPLQPQEQSTDQLKLSTTESAMAVTTGSSNPGAGKGAIKPHPVAATALAVLDELVRLYMDRIDATSDQATQAEYTEAIGTSCNTTTTTTITSKARRLSHRLLHRRR